MRKTATAGLALVGVLVLAACAAPGEERRAIEQQAERAGQVTLDGCLQQDAEGAFVLANARLGPQEVPAGVDAEPPPPVTGQSPMTTPAPVVGEGPHYQVEPPADVNLHAHVGQQLQITGSIQPYPDRAEGPVGTAGIRDEPAADFRGPVDGRLQAESVRILAASCIGPTR